jgi:hypothetical protein
MVAKRQYLVSAIDKSKGMIFIESADPTQVVNLPRVFREIESQHYNPKKKEWRVIYKDIFGVDYEVKLDYTRWPRSYAQWDRRFNPHVKKERWHGHMWDALKGTL